MTLELLIPEGDVHPYQFYTHDLQLFKELGVKAGNTYSVWAEGAVQEFQQNGYWYVFGYDLEVKGWTIFYHRKKHAPRSIPFELRRLAREKGRLLEPHRQSEELHFLDLSTSRLQVDYGKWLGAA